MLFRIKRGVHNEGGVTYRAGANDILESETDLVKVFGPEKFERARTGAKPSNPDLPELKESMAETKATAVEGTDTEEGKATSKAVQKAQETADEDKENESEEEGDDTENGEEGELGKDVTEKFSSAKDAELSVFKKGKEYFVTESDEPGEALNSAHLKSQKDVEKFIKSQTKK